MTMKRIITAFALSSVMLLIGSCTPRKENKATHDRSASDTTDVQEGTSAALTGTYWKLVEAMGKPAGTDLSKQPHIQLHEEDSLITGTGGCNSMSGSYKLLPNGRISFSQIVSTMMACPDMETEAAMSKALQTADSYVIIGDTLVLHRARMSPLARFVAVRESDEALSALNGTWELNYISGIRIAFDGLFPNRKPTIIFSLPETRVSGNGGCNSYSSNVSIEGHRIQFGEIASTKMYCEGVGEGTYFQTLKKISSYSVSGDGDTLTFIMDDVAMMRFSRK